MIIIFLMKAVKLLNKFKWKSDLFNISKGTNSMKSNDYEVMLRNRAQVNEDCVDDVDVLSK